MKSLAHHARPLQIFLVRSLCNTIGKEREGENKYRKRNKTPILHIYFIILST